ncbi:hypothetical protein [Nostoc sp.]|uniref:hypothetical protein n=1 Tax=Nostoc sp. TaxID=1180 RepID=UPI002FF7F830
MPTVVTELCRSAGYAYAAILKFFGSIWIELMKKQGQQKTFKPLSHLERPIIYTKKP